MIWFRRSLQYAVLLFILPRLSGQNVRLHELGNNFRRVNVEEFSIWDFDHGLQILFKGFWEESLCCRSYLKASRNRVCLETEFCLYLSYAHGFKMEEIPADFLSRTLPGSRWQQTFYLVRCRVPRRASTNSIETSPTGRRAQFHRDHSGHVQFNRNRSDGQRRTWTRRCWCVCSSRVAHHPGN